MGGKQFSVDELLNTLKEDPTEAVAEDTSLTEEELKKAVDSVSFTHKDEWLQDLEMNQIHVNEAEKILDTIIQKGFYEETYRIAGRVFKLRTRTTVDSDRLIEMLREMSPDSEAVASHLIARVNVASSLASFGENSFPHSIPTDDNRDLLDQEWRLRWSYISSLPQPIFLALAQTMQRFDLKVNLACDARGIENF